MPLYELIVMVKAGPPKASANMARSLSSHIIQNGGNVREVKILGDRYNGCNVRILTKPRMCNDKKKYAVGRFLQFLFDGSLECKDQAMIKAKTSYETMKIDAFRVENFYKRTQEYAKKVKQEDESRVYDPKKKMSQTIENIMTAKRERPVRPDRSPNEKLVL